VEVRPLQSSDVVETTLEGATSQNQLALTNTFRLFGSPDESWLWINLPAKEKMKPAGYRDIPSAEIPVISLPGAKVKLVAGELELGGAVTQGPIAGLTTEPLYADVMLEAGAYLTLPIVAGLNAFLYVFEGAVQAAGTPVPAGSAAILSDGDSLTLSTAGTAGRVLLVAGRPIGEPVAQYGPFVMNTRDELEQAVNDYRAGRLTA
jgi:redox-sensitive bicupin YhaK (pirin superfamily)